MRLAEKKLSANYLTRNFFHVAALLGFTGPFSLRKGLVEPGSDNRGETRKWPLSWPIIGVAGVSRATWTACFL